MIRRRRFPATCSAGQALVAGFLDATGGGGWGPVGTPALLAGGRMEPRKVIGSIDTSEFLVAVAASLGFLLSLGSQGIDFLWVAAFLLGGLVAAPLAAWLVRLVPPRVLGSVVGGVILVTNARTLLRSDWLAVSGTLATAVYVVLYALWEGALAYSVRAHLREKAAEVTAEPQPVRV
ncbi:TSUP family transporter [Streptomyces sp. A30]|uniref:TSUP family transporter n=1 Tax=Streptomyces sp. A30 TaxID=2789273 RepID=UPI00397F6F62